MKDVRIYFVLKLLDVRPQIILKVSPNYNGMRIIFVPFFTCSFNHLHKYMYVCVLLVEAFFVVL